MKVTWTRNADEQRTVIIDTIALDNPAAALRMDDLFEETANRLVQYPKLGKPGEAPGTREVIPHPSYRMVYEVDDETVWILALIHTARQWPPIGRTNADLN